MEAELEKRLSRTPIMGTVSVHFFIAWDLTEIKLAAFAGLLSLDCRPCSVRNKSNWVTDG
ncbi:hypothetical protein BRCON_1446 [Candidatus Sumerlaea chitinivorans]|uniref:Uncharacterized protein n=1 Tax=Sumerlaea chitinivorans TaxID=2250252 RepID=A0A2Z4Y6V3_SUMC1|nr:hypothetical protein BRCON_1446 [Candidatus Sumerlaea chitinivorans]